MLVSCVLLMLACNDGSSDSATESPDNESLGVDTGTCRLDACGGDVVGSWGAVPDAGCSDSSSDICSDDPPVEDHGSTFDETLTFASDGTYENVFDATYDMSWVDTPSCLKDLYVESCEELEKFYGGFGDVEVTCKGDAATGCSCDMVGTWSHTDTGTYETDGTVLSGGRWDYFDDPGDYARPSTEYCVAGDQIAIQQYAFSDSDLHSIHVYARR